MADIAIFCSQFSVVRLTLAFCCLTRLLLGLVDLAPTHSTPQVVSLPPELLTKLDDAIAERNSDLKARQDLVAEFERLLKDVAPGQANLTEVGFKVRFLEALTNLRLNNLQLCESQIADLRSKVDSHAFPELSFRCRSLQAAVLLMKGRTEEGQRALEDLLATDLTQIPGRLVAKAQINHAHALKEIGRLDEAVNQYQSIMFKAIQDGDDTGALQSGNHLLSIFIDNEDLSAAHQIGTELEPIVSRNAKTMGALAIQLQKCTLQLEDGDIDDAIAGLNQLLLRPDLPPQLQGTTHRTMGEALDRKGDADAALVHLRIAKEKLNGLPKEITHCRIVEAGLLLRKGDYDGVMKELADEQDMRLTPAMKKKVYELKLESTLRQAGREPEAIWVRELTRASSDQQKRYLRLLTKDFENQLATVKRTLEEQHRQALDQAAADSDRLKQYRMYFLSGLIATCGICVSGLAFVHFRRRSEKIRLDEQLALNAKLESLVDAKTLEIKANLAAQAELSQALERKKRVETVGLLAGNVAHDINNLLQVIANANQTLADETSPEHLRRLALRTSDESLQHGAGIVGQILAYSRQKELSEKSICVGEYLENSRALFQSAIGATNSLHIKHCKQSARVYVDTSQLTTMLLNLFSNAADAMPAGGTITVEASTEQVACGQSHIPEGEFVHLTIRDTGTGFQPEDLTRAFEPFFSTKPVGSGTGLGLSSARSFVDRSGGHIQIESQPGAGTCVHIWLPVHKSSEVTPPQAPPNASTSLAGRRLLLVEDHESVAKSMVLLLKQMKLDVVWSSSGDNAAELLQQDSQFDFVLSDVRMPGTLDGVQLARWIASKFPELPVVLMSGYTDVQLEELNVPYLHKPFKLAELKTTLCDLLKLGS